MINKIIICYELIFYIKIFLKIIILSYFVYFNLFLKFIFF